ncbi:MAG: type IV-A pilus assembly ATPase PilB [Gammaproteobacteria bacterium]|nr:type IV-A pilus assembly ATPase PilB [Gammaproteobacteria bacterium]
MNSMHAASVEFGIPLLDLNAFDTSQIPLDLLDAQLIRHHRLLPLYRHQGNLYIAITTPTSLAILNEFKFKTGLNPYPLLVEDRPLNLLIDKILMLQASNALTELKIQADLRIDEDTSSTQDTPVTRFVHKILCDAMNQGVSDIHFEPFEKTYRIRYRRDGVLYETASVPPALSSRMTARLKVLAQIDIAERRLPQDGHFKMALSDTKSLDFRINTCPTINGEKVVIRVLDPAAAQIGIDTLGFEAAQQQLFLATLQKPQGMVLVTGPTGSGKTMSLYAALGILNTEALNISTIEDPVEMNLPGINQVPVNLKIGLGFATALRTFLRQDPDIIMVGEIRDLETAEIAIKAAQTGHLVLSTLHTNSASETLTRLLNMGLPAFNVATSVSLIVAQRLARRLCPQCKQIETIPPKSLIQIGFSENEIDSGFSLFTPHPSGCNHCHRGYAGRIGLYEVMPISANIAQVIMKGGHSLDILQIALEEGLQTLRRSGLNRVREGLTSLAEIYRVT